MATTPVFYGESVRSILDAGVIGSVDADPQLTATRGVGFWYLTAGLVLGYTGVTAARSERQRGRPPEGFAPFMAAVGLWGVLLSPRSGFWLFLPIAALARRNRRTAPAGPQGERAS